MQHLGELTVFKCLECGDFDQVHRSHGALLQAFIRPWTKSAIKLRHRSWYREHHLKQLFMRATRYEGMHFGLNWIPCSSASFLRIQPYNRISLNTHFSAVSGRDANLIRSEDAPHNNHWGYIWFIFARNHRPIAGRKKFQQPLRCKIEI